MGLCLSSLAFSNFSHTLSMNNTRRCNFINDPRSMSLQMGHVAGDAYPCKVVVLPSLSCQPRAFPSTSITIFDTSLSLLIVSSFSNVAAASQGFLLFNRSSGNAVPPPFINMGLRHNSRLLRASSHLISLL